MSRPKTKTELLELSQLNFEKLTNLVDGYSDAEQERAFPKSYLNRNIRDVLSHLYHWHLMMKDWYEVGMSGEKPDIPAKGYTWKTVPDLNLQIREKYKDLPLKSACEKLENSHREIMKIIDGHSDEELFEKKRYHWTGSTSLGAYLISSTSSHYDWAFKLIKKCMKATEPKESVMA